MSDLSPVSGVKPTWAGRRGMSACDPTRTLPPGMRDLRRGGLRRNVYAWSLSIAACPHLEMPWISMERSHW